MMIDLVNCTWYLNSCFSEDHFAITNFTLYRTFSRTTDAAFVQHNFSKNTKL